MSADLAAFLLARYDDEEALALEASWRFSERTATTEPVAAHIARWDPARVLTECEARRRIVERWQETAPTRAAWGGVGHSSAEEQIIHETLADDVLPLLALPYADHPDYDPAWRP